MFSPFFDVFVKRVFDAWTAIGPTPPKVHWCATWALPVCRPPMFGQSTACSNGFLCNDSDTYRCPLLSYDESCAMRRAKKNSYTEDQLLHAGVGPNNNDYWERYVQRTMEPYIATFRPVVAEADPAGLFRQKYLDNLFGIERS